MSGAAKTYPLHLAEFGYCRFGKLLGSAAYTVSCGTAGDTQTLITAVCGTALAFILSQYGLPAAAVRILAERETLNDAVRAI